jgi:phosphoribosyl 1,2-cyclic phosphodiesterase
MSLKFKTIISSSSGNCMMLQTENTTILIDCGFKSQKACKQALEDNFPDPSVIDGVFVTHLHGDHINYSSLKVLQQKSVNLYVYHECVDLLRSKHYKGYAFPELNVRTYRKEPMTIADLTIEPIEVPHHPNLPTHGFSVTYHHKDRDYKILLAADFSDGENLIPHLVDADMIYIESNHDLELLDLNFNPNSFYHMNNPATAKLLADAFSARKTPPKAVVLGHLSDRRNEDQLAIKEVQKAFVAADLKIEFKLIVAPQSVPLEEISIP